MDVRYQQDISAYAAWQAGNRQLNRESLEYNRMREHYQGREDEMPYKTLGSFGKARRSATLSPAFKKWRYRNRDARQYEEWIRILGVENMPETVDNFQQIKYNNRKKYGDLEFEVFQSRTRKLIGTKDYPLKLKEGDQGKHVKGHNNYRPEANKSYFIEGKEKELINSLMTKCGTGEMLQKDQTDDKRWNGKELLVFGSPIGWVNDNNGNWVKTNKVIVHYSKKGVHFVPTLRKTRKEREKNDSVW